jgi:hypothetical protein
MAGKAQVEQDTPDPDLRYWAAYVVGHHPQTLRLWQRELIREIVWTGGVAEDTTWRPLWGEVDELNDALRLLALEEQLSAVMLVELHRAIDEFARISRELPDRDDPIDPENLTAPGYWPWRDMQGFAAKVVGPSEDLRLWAQLGAAVGMGQYVLGADPGPEDYVPECVGKIGPLMRKLAGSGQAILRKEVEAAVKGVKKPPEKQSIDACLRRSRERFREVCRLDERLRAGLRNRPPEEPLLVLDADSVTFLGERRPLTDYPQAEMACLWVLAENAGREVRRETIIWEGGIQTNEDNLKYTVTRLRKILKDLASGQHHESDDPRRSKDSFIPTGRRAPRHERGSYKLAIAPGRVRISGSPPDWLHIRQHS